MMSHNSRLRSLGLQVNGSGIANVSLVMRVADFEF